MTEQQRDPELDELLGWIRDQRGFDFTGYKRPSLTRRISRRMQAVGVSSYPDYRRYLDEHDGEFVELFNTILINVTSFFRDEIAWDYLRDEVAPQVVELHDGVSGQIRLWSTGCATGEEAFSLAMVFAEVLGEDAYKARVKIYATDIDDDALTHGRQAEFTAKQLTPVPEEYRHRYFEERNGGFTFRSDLRRSVIFGRHDLIQDPPISRISLLLSRNTLMYFDAQTQRGILANFHFALRDGGYLFVGKSEALAARSHFFVPVDLKKRIFMKPRQGFDVRRIAVASDGNEAALAQLATEALIRDASFDTVPVAQLVVDREGNLALANLQARALVGLSARDIGKPFRDLDVSFRPVELRSRIEHVYSERQVITLRDLEFRSGDEVRFVDVQIAPLVASTGTVVGAGVTFIEVTRYRRLQQALDHSKRDMETAHEELQSTVEELETTNEELQSTNEELETMNEELQSTNEELETMNDEVNERSLELNESNAFLEAILGSISAGVMVVDKELVVTAWNDGAVDLWGVRHDEAVGTHLFNLDLGLPLDALRSPIRDVVSSGEGQMLTLSAVNRRGRTFDCRISLMPLLSALGGVRGAVMLMEEASSGSDGAGP